MIVTIEGCRSVHRIPLQKGLGLKSTFRKMRLLPVRADYAAAALLKKNPKHRRQDIDER